MDLFGGPLTFQIRCRPYRLSSLVKRVFNHLMQCIHSYALIDVQSNRCPRFRRRFGGEGFDLTFCKFSKIQIKPLLVADNTLDNVGFSLKSLGAYTQER